jgi:hypothetical protein
VLVMSSMGLTFFLLFLGTGAGVDVGEVERLWLGEVAQLEHDDNRVFGVFKGGGPAHPGAVLGAQLEFPGGVPLLGMGLPALGTATGATDHQDDSRKRHNAQEYRNSLHWWKDTIGTVTMHQTCSLCVRPMGGVRMTEKRDRGARHGNTNRIDMGRRAIDSHASRVKESVCDASSEVLRTL